MNDPIHIISLGAGVQSSTMALMAAAGEITPMPKCAIFADTQAEPKSVYVWLNWLEKQLPFPVYRVTAGRLTDFLFDGYRGKVGRFVHLPTYGSNGGMGFRACTADFKIGPIRKEVRRLCRHCILWIGISTDESSRMKDSQVGYIENRWPLVELRMNRHECQQWLTTHYGKTAPKSACTYCPFHSDSAWRAIRAGGDWPQVVEIDRRLNGRGEFLHSSLKPISEVDFSTEEERGQLNMFNNECEGLCGV